MRGQFLLFSAVLAALLSACSGGQGRRPVAATEEKEAAESAPQSVMYNVDATKSRVAWTGSKPTGQHNGVFSVAEGEVYVSGDDLTAASFTVAIGSLSVEDIPQNDPDNAKLKGHLLSADFFDAENFPMATFTLTGADVYTPEEDEQGDVQARRTAEGSPEGGSSLYTHTLSGNLQLRGVSKNITFPAVVSISGGSFTLAADFTIDRTDFGMVYGDQTKLENKVANRIIHNEVSLSIVLHALAPADTSSTEEEATTGGV